MASWVTFKPSIEIGIQRLNLAQKMVSVNYVLILTFSFSFINIITSTNHYAVPNKRLPVHAEEFDFIIVGGGTAGCVVASRLSENINYTILVLEAGDVPHSDWTVPALSPQARETSGDAKIYNSLPQRNAAAGNNGIVPYMVGRTLGGTSTINGMIFNRGSPYDYQNWADLTGDPSWNYKNLLKYFKRMEDYHGAYPFSAVHHGKGGPIPVTSSKYAPLAEEWKMAGEHLGYRCADPNGPQLVSFSKLDSSKEFGRRISSFNAYIQPHLLHRPNLKIITMATVNQILFDGNIAVGVMYKKKNILQFVKAKREIIICAGVIGSPEILLKSGVGPENVLRSLKMRPIKYLPVGENLHDHVGVALNIILNNISATFIASRDLNPANYQFYETYGDGPYSYPGAHSQALVTSSIATKHNPNWPDIQIVFAGHNLGGNDLSTLVAGGDNNLSLAANESIISILATITRPKSRGRVVLNGSDPFNNDAVMDPQYLTHPDDMDALIDSIKITLNAIENTPAFQKLGARYPETPIQSCAHLSFRSTAYWKCFIRQVSFSGLHAGGTCRMGRIGDPNAVVDSQLRVIGIRGLRVADTSVMPQVTNANTQVPAYLIGEKLSEMILG